MYRVGVVVLNYINYSETVNCVNSILIQDYPDLRIVIVDNGSNNESETILRETFETYKNVSLLAVEKNLGFAKGNNVGINFLRKEGCEFVLVINSDIIFSEKDIISHGISEWEDGVGLVNFPTNRSNGVEECRTKFSKKYLRLRIIKQLLIVEFKYMFHIGKNQKKGTANTDSAEITNTTKTASNTTTTKRDINEYVVTGCAYGLTPSYFNKYDKLYDRTFLYFEEDALIIQLHVGHLDTMQVGTAPLIHKHGASSDNVRTDIARQSARIVLRMAILGK